MTGTIESVLVCPGGVSDGTVLNGCANPVWQSVYVLDPSQQAAVEALLNMGGVDWDAALWASGASSLMWVVGVGLVMHVVRKVR